MYIISTVSIYRPPSDMILKEFKRMLHNIGYVTQEMTEEPPSQPNPSFAVIRDKENVISLVIFGNVFSYVVERTIRFFRYYSVILQSIDVFDINSEEQLLSVKARGAENIFQELQDLLIEKNWEHYDLKFVVKLGTASKPAKKIIKKRDIPSISPIMSGKAPKKQYITPFKPSPVMLKSKKLSQLKKREKDDMDLAPSPSIKGQQKQRKTEEEIQEEILKSLTDAPLNEDERAILKEILKHPKRKVQSNHIKKKTGLDQEVIRATLRQLVNKNILRVSSGWYILKKAISTPLANKASQTQLKKPVVRSEARIRKLRAKIEAESFGERDTEDDDMYPEQTTTKKGHGDPFDENTPFSEEQEFYSPVTDEEDLEGGMDRSKPKRREGYDDDFENDYEDFGGSSWDEEL